MEWVWLLHDDCEPAPDALEQLLRGAAEARTAAVLGPKVMDWSDRRVLLEAGVTIDTAGRRITGIEPREVDQGQHDGDRDVLAVTSAGMLVRRDVWDQAGGFDPGMPLFRDDVDFCWRVHAAGHRVRVVTDAVVYHLEATARNRRSPSAAPRPRRADRHNALFTLLANLPLAPAAAALAGNLVLSTLRTLFFLLAKRPHAALDELAAVGSVLAQPFRLLAARRRRARGRRAAYSRLRSELPRGRSLRRLAEFAASVFYTSTQIDTAGSHHATDDPDDDEDYLLVDSGLAQRILTNPGVLLFAGLTTIALVAERSLLTAGTLAGGALSPAWGGVSPLWQEYLQGFHPAGIGSATSTPPYVAVIAALATLLGGKPWLAIDVIMIGCIPLAGLAAFFAARRITTSVAARVWAGAAYALLPVGMGAVAAGRFGSAVVFTLLPVIAMVAARIFTAPGRRARRAAWASGLLIAIAAAFVPLIWVAAVAGAILAAVTIGRRRRRTLLNLVIAVVVPPVLLLPWTVQVATRPALLFLEAGNKVPGLATADLPARSLLLLSPGGPGLPPFWVTGGIALAALAALLLTARRSLVLAGWSVALLGLVIAVGVSRILVTPAGAARPIAAWPGISLALAAAGLVLAAVVAADVLPAQLGDGHWRQPRGLGILLLAVVAASAPLLAAASWVTGGVRGPDRGIRRAGAARLRQRVLRHRAAAAHAGAAGQRPGRGELRGAPRRRPAARHGRSHPAAVRPAGAGQHRVHAGRAARRRRPGPGPGSGRAGYRLRAAARTRGRHPGQRSGQRGRAAAGEHDHQFPALARRGHGGPGPGDRPGRHGGRGAIRAGGGLRCGRPARRRDPGPRRAGRWLVGHPQRHAAATAGLPGRWLGPGLPAPRGRRDARYLTQPAQPGPDRCLRTPRPAGSDRSRAARGPAARRERGRGGGPG